MATVRISDVVVPELFDSYDSLDFMNKNVFVKSGVAFADPQVSALMDGVSGGNLISLPFWNTLGDTEPNIGSDDPSVKSTPEKITAGYELATKTFVNKSYSAMDLSALLAGSDPMRDIQSKIDGMWQIDINTRLLKAASGICADSVTNHDSDLVLDISGSTGAGETPLLNGDSIIEATGKLGDRQNEMKIIAMHGVIYNSLRRQQLIETVRDADNNTLFEVFGNMRVLVDDAMPVSDLGGGKRGYYTYIFADNVFSFNSGNPGVAQEIDRNADAGNGQGEELLYTRRCWLVHPRGYQLNVASFSGGVKGLSYAQLAAANTWTRVWDDRKRIKFVAIKSQG